MVETLRKRIIKPNKNIFSKKKKKIKNFKSSAACGLDLEFSFTTFFFFHPLIDKNFFLHI